MELSQASANSRPGNWALEVGDNGLERSRQNSRTLQQQPAIPSNMGLVVGHLQSQCRHAAKLFVPRAVQFNNKVSAMEK